MSTPPDATPVRIRKRRGLLLFALALITLILLFAIGARTLLKPQNLTPILLEHIGDTMGLVITAQGESEYGWEPFPRIVMRGIDARQPGSAKPVLTAERVLVSMPWNTVKTRGESLVIERVELDAPMLDMAALQRWQQSRPPSTTRRPNLERGVRVVRGELRGDGWTVRDLLLDVSAFHPAQPLQGIAKGRFEQPAFQLPFDVAIAMTKPKAHAGVGINGVVTPTAADWSLPTRFRMRGMLDAQDGEATLTPGTLGASMRYLGGDTDIPLVIGVHGDWRGSKNGLDVDPAQVSLRGQDVIPSFDSHGRLHVGSVLDIRLAGVLPGWLSAWPALPAPLNRSHSPLPFDIAYFGQHDVTDPVSLRLQRDATRFDGKLRPRDVLAWSNARAAGTPLPPLDGHLVTPRLEISGAVLEGVEIRTDDRGVP